MIINKLAVGKESWQSSVCSWQKEHGAEIPYCKLVVSTIVNRFVFLNQDRVYQGKCPVHVAKQRFHPEFLLD